MLRLEEMLQVQKIKQNLFIYRRLIIYQKIELLNVWIETTSSYRVKNNLWFILIVEDFLRHESQIKLLIKLSPYFSFRLKLKQQCRYQRKFSCGFHWTFNVVLMSHSRKLLISHILKAFNKIVSQSRWKLFALSFVSKKLSEIPFNLMKSEERNNSPTH